MNGKVYIIDKYYPHLPPAQGEKCLYVFTINEQQSCIKEVELEWGMPRIATPIDDKRSEYACYKYFDTYEEAEKYVRLLKELNR